MLETSSYCFNFTLSILENNFSLTRLQLLLSAMLMFLYKNHKHAHLDAVIGTHYCT